MKLSPKILRTLTAVGAVVLAAVVAGVLALLGDDGASTNTASATATPSGTSLTSAARPNPGSVATPVKQVDGVPDHAFKTLTEIDAGRWPESANSPGTKGGGPWQNRGGDLPAKDDSGKKITYQEWDVNPKIQGQSRDAERIVTGSDGSAWYTGDHYKTFTRMR
ncbi:guanyl-specific ribonuclease [Nocardia callitridis]|uniref:Uncharacterized protein n=1 Tax=Nocardia callitridis TaxID=648753 RepID=A0ABP9JTC5_9NOCA